MNTYSSNNIKNCSHKIISEKLHKISRAYFYCYKCGKLIIVKGLKMYESITSGKLEFNPIKVIHQMLLSSQDKLNNDINDISDLYSKNRDLFIHYIKQYCRRINYNKSTFFLCLYLIDLYLPYCLKKEISRRNIALITLGFFLLAVKFNENDIYEPKLNIFCKIEKDITFTVNEIMNMEIKCLKIMEYNLINYSAFDWLKILNKVGYIFNSDINKIKIEQIKDRQKLLLRRLIYSDILYKYESFQIALSIIHISMDNIFYTDKTSKELFTLFLSIFEKKFSYYKSCFINIKSFLLNDFTQSINDKEKENEKNANTLKTTIKHPLKLSCMNKTRTKKLINYLSSMLDKKKSQNNNNKILIIQKEKNQTEEENKIANTMKNYIVKLKTLDSKNQKMELITSKDFNSFSSINNKINQKNEKQHLAIECSTNNNINNSNNLFQNQNYVISEIQSINNNNINNINITKESLSSNKKYILNNKNQLLKKSITSLCNSPLNIKNKEEKNEFGSNMNIFKDKNILKKYGFNKGNLNKHNDFNNIKGSMKFIGKKSQIKEMILKKDGFYHSSEKIKENKIALIKKNYRNKLGDNKTLISLKKNRTNYFLSNFIKDIKI